MLLSFSSVLLGCEGRNTYMNGLLILVIKQMRPFLFVDLLKQVVSCICTHRKSALDYQLCTQWYFSVCGSGAHAAPRGGSCLCICCSFWLNFPSFTFPSGSSSQSPLGVPSPLAFPRTLLLQRSVPFSCVISFPSSRDKSLQHGTCSNVSNLNEKRNTHSNYQFLSLAPPSQS